MASLDSYLVSPAAALVSLVGMAKLHPALSQLARSTSANPPPRYLSFAVEQAYAKYQPSRSGVQPELVLKHDWLHKHLRVSSAVVVLFIAWDDATSPSAVCAQLGIIRRASRKSCRVLLVLVQASTRVSSQSSTNDERVLVLRRACDLEARNVLLVAAEGTDEAPRLEIAVAQRVEHAVMEAAAAYYREEARRSRKARNSSPQLIARYHFKRAIYCELAHDGAAAQRQWYQTYSQLQELLRAMGLILPVASEADRAAAGGVRLHEVKRVAEFVNRKICGFGFASPASHTEAFDEFRRHVRLFRPLVLPDQQHDERSQAAAAHLHYGWLGKQYRTLAKRAEEVYALAPANSTNTVACSSYGEPGFYYQAAASCALQRRKQAEFLERLEKRCDDASDTVTHSSVTPVLIEGRPWGALARELGVTTDVASDVDSRVVIDMLTKAYDRFRRKRSRMVYFLAAQMADEYMHIRDFDMAKRFLVKIVRAYHLERWWNALAHIQRSLRICALELRELPNFLNSSVALLSRELSTPEEAECVLLDLLGLVRLAPPSKLVPFLPLSSPALVEIRPDQHLLHCTAEWPVNSLPLGGSTTLSLRLSSSLAVPISPSALRLVSSDATLSQVIRASDSSSPSLDDTAITASNCEPLLLQANGTLNFELLFTPRNCGTTTVQHLEVLLGNPPCNIVLTLPFPTCDGSRERPNISVTPPAPTLRAEIESAQPVLQNEFAPLRIRLHPGGGDLDNAFLCVTTSDAASSSLPLPAIAPGDIKSVITPVPGASATQAPATAPSFSTSPTATEPGQLRTSPNLTRTSASPAEALDLLDHTGAPLKGRIQLPTIRADKVHEVVVLIRSRHEGAFDVSAVVEYTAGTGGGVGSGARLPPRHTVDASYRIHVVPSLKLSCTFILPPDQARRRSLQQGEPVRLLMTASCLAPPPISVKLEALRIEPKWMSPASSPNIQSGVMEERIAAFEAVPPGVLQVDCASAVIRQGADFSALLTLSPTVETTRQSLGSIVASWKRGEGDDCVTSIESAAPTEALLRNPSPDMQFSLSQSSARHCRSLTSHCISETRCPLPEVAVQPCDFEVQLENPSESTLGELFSLRLSVTNHTCQLHSFRLSISENDAFLFCGFKLHHFHLPPSASHHATFNLVPIAPGFVHLPPLQLLCISTNKEMFDDQARATVFVRPCGVNLQGM